MVRVAGAETAASAAVAEMALEDSAILGLAENEMLSSYYLLPVTMSGVTISGNVVKGGDSVGGSGQGGDAGNGGAGGKGGSAACDAFSGAGSLIFSGSFSAAVRRCR